MSAPFTDITVVVVEIAHHRIVCENGEIDTGFFSAIQYGRGLAAGDEGGYIPRYARGLAIVPTKRAAQSIGDSAFGLMCDLGGDILVFQGRSVGANFFGDGLH